ncbi:MAG: DNA replication and repair protein RecF, partial [Rhodospirillales bacterium]
MTITRGLARNDIDPDGDAGAVSGAAARAPGLALEQLILTHFRNYTTLRLPCDARPVVLTGSNGAGKTNLLEAISFLVPGRGLRRARLTDVACREDGSEPDVAVAKTAWGVAARLDTPSGPLEIGTGCDGATDAAGRVRRIVHIDGQTVSNQAVLSEHVNVQWLTPQMDRLFLEGAGARRRFLDRLVFGFDPAHAGRVAAYEHALRERARLLRAHGPRADAAWLAALEETMAAKGVAVAAARRDAVARLEPACGESDGHFPAAA